MSRIQKIRDRLKATFPASMEDLPAEGSFADILMAAVANEIAQLEERAEMLEGKAGPTNEPVTIVSIDDFISAFGVQGWVIPNTDIGLTYTHCVGGDEEDGQLELDFGASQAGLPMSYVIPEYSTDFLEAEKKFKECEECNGFGEVELLFSKSKCRVCDGTGSVEDA